MFRSTARNSPVRRPFTRLLPLAAMGLALIAAPAGAWIRTPDLFYTCAGNTTRNRFDLFTASGGITYGVPTIIDLHGGGYTTGDKTHDLQLCGRLADMGYNVIAMNYTLAVPGVSSSFPQTIRDVRAVIHWVRTTGVQVGLSPTIVIIGQSAGGTIGLAAAYAPESPEFDPGLPPPPFGYKVDAAVGMFGRYDLVWNAQVYGSPPTIIDYLGMPITAPGGLALYTAAAARTYVDPCSVPTKLIVGELDGLVQPGNTYRLAQALTDAGVFNLLQSEPSAGHGSGVLGSPSYLANSIAPVIPTLLSARRPGCGGAAPPGPPPNDACEGAITIAPGTTTLGITHSATGDSAGPCGTNDRIDLWYRFVAPDSLQYTIDTAGSVSLTNASLSVFESCAPGAPPLACGERSDLDVATSVRVVLSAGEAVLIRLAGNQQTVGAFSLNVDQGRPYYPPPANDLCSAAVPALPGASMGTTLGARPSSGEMVCALPGEQDVFFSFTAEIAGRYRFDTGFTLDINRLSLGVLSTCFGPALACANNYSGFPIPPRPAVEVPLIAGQTVVLRIGSTEEDQGTFVLEISRLPAPTGACCSQGQCSISENDACTASNGTFFQSQACAAIPCNPIGPPPGACCSGTICTVVAAAGDCSGAFTAAGVTCGAADNPVACCPANFNQVSGLSVQDIFDFLGAYFAGAITGDFNDSGAVSVQDVFDFLAAYFAGCA